MKRIYPKLAVIYCVTTLCMAGLVSAEDKKPNILIIWGDDIGMWNISAYHRGMMGGSTPNIDRLAESKRFIKDAVEAEKPFFVWHNTTRMHYRTNLNEGYEGKSGYGIYADGMMELDDDVGELLDLLDELGVADNTIVMFSTDNGAPSNSWPDGGNHPFHGEKGAGGWEGGFKVPMLVKWKDKIPAGTHIL